MKSPSHEGKVVKLRVFLWSLSHPKFLRRTAGVKCLVTAVAMEDKDLKLG